MYTQNPLTTLLTRKSGSLNNNCIARIFDKNKWQIFCSKNYKDINKYISCIFDKHFVRETTRQLTGILLVFIDKFFYNENNKHFDKHFDKVDYKHNAVRYNEHFADQFDSSCQNDKYYPWKTRIMVVNKLVLKTGPSTTTLNFDKFDSGRFDKCQENALTNLFLVTSDFQTFVKMTTVKLVKNELSLHAFF